MSIFRERIESGRLELEYVPVDIRDLFDGIRDLFSGLMEEKTIDLMGGTIDVLTAPGSGTTIVIRLKFRLAEEKDLDGIGTGNADDKSEDMRDTEFSGKRVLLVEDNLINMEIANMILTQSGFTVETAENGKIAVDMVFSSEPGYYDAVLMDIQMPEMDGYEATRAIRSLEDRRLASIPILAMSANAFKEDELAAEEAGMQAHIAKPIDVGLLLRTLKEVLSKREE